MRLHHITSIFKLEITFAGGTEVDGRAIDSLVDWEQDDLRAHNTSLWITLVIASLSIAIVAVIILGPRYLKKCLRKIRRRLQRSRGDVGTDRGTANDNMRYLYGEWDPSTDSEQTTPSGVHLNAMELVMSTYVAGTVVGTTYDDASRDGNGYSYLCRDDCRHDASFDDLMATEVSDVSPLQDGELSESERTADNDECIENMSIEHDDIGCLSDHLRNTFGVSDDIADSSNAEIGTSRTTNKLEMKNCTIDDCRPSDDSDNSDSSREEISGDSCMYSTSEENGIPP